MYFIAIVMRLAVSPTPSTLRDITALDPGRPSCLPADPDAKVDIRSLTWEDKERVLRLLFAKINNVQVRN